jgi:hypothetical protein
MRTAACSQTCLRGGRGGSSCLRQRCSLGAARRLTTRSRSGTEWAPSWSALQFLRRVKTCWCRGAETLAARLLWGCGITYSGTCVSGARDKVSAMNQRSKKEGWKCSRCIGCPATASPSADKGALLFERNSPACADHRARSRDSQHHRNLNLRPQLSVQLCIVAPSPSAPIVTITRQTLPSSNNGKLNITGDWHASRSQLTPRRTPTKPVCPKAGRFAAPTRRISPTTSIPRQKIHDGSRQRAPTRKGSSSTWHKTIAQRASHRPAHPREMQD